MFVYLWKWQKSRSLRTCDVENDGLPFQILRETPCGEIAAERMRKRDVDEMGTKGLTEMCIIFSLSCLFGCLFVSIFIICEWKKVKGHFNYITNILTGEIHRDRGKEIPFHFLRRFCFALPFFKGDRNIIGLFRQNWNFDWQGL